MSAGESDLKFIKEAANQLNGLLTELSGFVSVMESLLRSTSEGKELLPMVVGTLDRASNLTNKLQTFIYEKEGHSEAARALSTQVPLLDRGEGAVTNQPNVTPILPMASRPGLARIPLGPMRQVGGPVIVAGEDEQSPAPVGMAAVDGAAPAEPNGEARAPTPAALSGHGLAENGRDGAGSKPTRSVDPGLMGSDELIMVVDDEKNILMLVEMMLKSANYRLIKASSGEEALVLFDEHADNIALTILDFTMEGMNGRDVFLRIIEKQPEARVLMSSGYAEASALKEMLAKGLRGYIPKPYSRDRLLFQVKSVLSA